MNMDGIQESSQPFSAPHPLDGFSKSMEMIILYKQRGACFIVCLLPMDTFRLRLFDIRRETQKYPPKKGGKAFCGSSSSFSFSLIVFALLLVVFFDFLISIVRDARVIKIESFSFPFSPALPFVNELVVRSLLLRCWGKQGFCYDGSRDSRSQSDAINSAVFT